MRCEISRNKHEEEIIVIQGMVEVHKLSSFRLTPDSDDVEGVPMISLVVLVPEADPGFRGCREMIGGTLPKRVPEADRKPAVVDPPTGVLLPEARPPLTLIPGLHL